VHKNFPESGRGLGHVTPTIFDSTVGYPSDSFTSCSSIYFQAIQNDPVTIKYGNIEILYHH